MTQTPSQMPTQPLRKKSTPYFCLLLSALNAATTQAGPAPIAPQYVLQDLGTLPGDDYSQANAINDQGQVVGASGNLQQGTSHAVLFQAAAVKEIAATGAATPVNGANAINNQGKVAGFTSNGNGATPVSFLYANGQAQAFTPLGSPQSEPLAINAAGQMVGYYVAAGSFHQRAFLRQPNANPVDLGTFGGTDANATAIDTQGQIAGWFETADGVMHAFLAQPGGLQPKDLGNLGGTNKSALAFGLNDAGQVVGYAYAPRRPADSPYAQPYHAFLYSAGKMSDLGTLGGTYSSANAVNASGEVVGDANTANGDVHGFLYWQGKMEDLNALLQPEVKGWTIIGAIAINGHGQIAAGATGADGFPHAVLLTPTP